ncbi:MAG: hypothetical protein GY752_09120 [bacterium]|nr:hypothetical protein [bacterium]
MGGLLKKLAKGLGAGMTSYGTSMLENKRQARLESIRKSERTEDKKFKTSEREAKQIFDAGESELDRKARIEASKHRGGSTTLGGVKNLKEFKDEESGEVTSRRWTKGDDIFDEDLITGELTRTAIDGAVEVIRKPSKTQDPGETPNFQKEGADWADDKASWMPGSDSKDFGPMKTEDRAATAYTELLADAHANGYYDKFIARMQRPDAMHYLAKRYNEFTSRNK